MRTPRAVPRNDPAKHAKVNSRHIGLSNPLSDAAISTSLESARRLAVTKQHLAGKTTGSAADAILSVIRDLGYVQLDPINTVAPSHVLVLWSRVGNFRLSDLDRLLWDEKKLFEHWSHAASIVLTEDYPLHYSLMRRYPESLSKSWGGWRAKARTWLARHTDLRKAILRQLKRGPLGLTEFQDYVPTKRGADGWTLGKRCLRSALPPANARRGDGRGPPRKPENLGPAGNVPAELGREEGTDRTRGRAGRCGEDDPSPRHRVPFRDQRLFSARSVSEPEKGPGTFAEGIGNPSGSNHGARWQGRTICP